MRRNTPWAIAASSALVAWVLACEASSAFAEDAPSVLTPIHFAYGVRVGGALQDPDEPKRLTELHLDTTYVDARFTGDVVPAFSWRVVFDADLIHPTLAPAGSVGLMDLVAQFHPAHEFNVWAGRLLVPSDRAIFAGPFFQSPWDVPGGYVPGAPPLGAKTGSLGRDGGAVVWGSVFGDRFKYYGGAFGLDKDAPPYFVGRLSYNFVGPEPGYSPPATYYGERDVVAVGIAGQTQQHGALDLTTGGTRTMRIGIVDAIAEHVVPNVGTFSAWGQVYKFGDGYSFAKLNGQPVFAPEEAFSLVFSYLTPRPLGVGKLQPLVRLQQTLDPNWTIFDTALAYVLRKHSLRVVATYEHVDRGSQGGVTSKENVVELGVQVQSL
ncbi:MAG: hypothetical protein ABTD50_02115 [Polyangiaceae bacterium]|jgi:hypothetical protein